MTESPGPAHLAEAIDHLAAHRIEVVADWIDGAWRYTIDGVVVTEGDVVAKAVALGMFGGSERVQ